MAVAAAEGARASSGSWCSLAVVAYEFWRETRCGPGDGPRAAKLASGLTVAAGMGDAAREYAAKGLRKDLLAAA